MLQFGLAKNFVICLTLSQLQILDFAKLKVFVDDNLKFDENDGKSPKRIENTGGKG